jgi:hypothetical protein
MTTLHKDLVGTNLHDPKPHTHTESEITDLGSYADASHTHVEADITDLGSYLDQAAADLLYEPLGGGGGGGIPHYDAWDDEPLKLILRGIYVSLSGSGETVVLPVGSFVAAFVHGYIHATNDPPNLAISRDSGSSWSAWDDDPSVPSISVTESDIGQVPIMVAADDGYGAVVVAESFVVIVDSDGFTPP